MSLSPGVRLGPYEIVSRLGAGGMGEVYRAMDTRLDRIVALKVLPSDRVSDAEARGRFHREAKSIAALNHPNICAIHDVGLDAGAPPYLVMELLDGQTLQERLLRGPLDVDQVVEYGSALADALDAAHARGLIHRDLKPANIFITSRGIPKILDFGLAKALGADAAHAAAGAELDVTRRHDDPLTELGTTVGTVAYMSPEQLRGEPLDVRSDLFSFGMVLYEMATGRRAFAGATSAVVSAAILTQDPPMPTSARPDLPPRLEETILKALEKDRQLRCQSAAELRADLTRLKRQSGSQTTRTAAAVTAAPSSAAITTTSIGAPAAAVSSAGTTSKRGPWIAVGLLGGAAILAGGYLLSQGTGKPATPTSGQTPASVSAPPTPTATPQATTEPAISASKSAGAAATSGSTPAPRASASPTPAPTAAAPTSTPTAEPAPTPAAAGATAARGPGTGRRGLGPNGPALVSLLKGLPPLPFDLLHATGDERARELAMQLRTVLTMGGWTLVNVSQTPPTTLHQFTVFVPQPSQSATALISWARRNGFTLDVKTAPRAPRLRIVINR